MTHGNDSNTEMLAAALGYALRGWPVFPLQPAEHGDKSTGKLPLIRSAHKPGHGCHGECGAHGHGFYDATLDERVIGNWWGLDGAPDANIGIRTGSKEGGGSGFWALDIDAGTDALAYVGKVAGEHGDPTGECLATRQAATGGGGLHALYRFDADTIAWLKLHGRTLGCRAKIEGVHGLDVRGDGGYIVASPSRHWTGGVYSWADERDPVTAPEWLLLLVSKPIDVPRGPPPVIRGTLPGDSRERRYGIAVLKGACKRIDEAGRAGDGRRTAIFSSAITVGGFVATGAIDEAEAEAVLLAAGRATGTGNDVSKAVADGLRYGKDRPLDVPEQELTPLQLFAVELLGELPPDGDRRWKQVAWKFHHQGDEPPPPDDDDARWTGDVRPAASDGGPADDEEREPSGWEAPLAIGDAFAPSPFPLASLPPVLRAFVEGLAENTATPPDMAGMAALGVCATTLAGRVRGCAWWSEPVNLFAAVAMEPGSRKSAVLGEVVQPLLDAEKCEFARLAPDIQAAKMKIKILDARVRAAESAAAKAEADTDRDSLTAAAIKAAQDRDAVPLPVAPRYFCDDVTPERLVGMLAEHGGRMALISAEGGPFAMMGGRYSDGVPNIDVILKGHAGDAIRVDRVGRPPEQIDSPALSMILAIQPDVVRGLAENPGFRGRGLLGRFLYAIPRSTVGTRPAQAPPMPATARAAYRGLVRRLLALPIPSSAPPELQFDESACLALKEFMAALEPRLGEAGDLGHMADWAGKLSGAVVRIASILHMVERAERTHPWEFRVGVDTVRDAIAIGQYLTEHARAAFAMMGADPELTAARHVLGWVAAHGGDAFVERDAYNGNRGRFGRMDAFRKALAILVEHGYLRADAAPRPAGKRGRKPSPRYAVNPMWTRP